MLGGAGKEQRTHFSDLLTNNVQLDILYCKQGFSHEDLIVVNCECIAGSQSLECILQGM